MPYTPAADASVFPFLRASRTAAAPIRLRLLVVAAGCATFAGLAGCRGRAQEELYREKLTREIRLLEDQLYEADYQNRVLMDKLGRARSRLREGRPDSDDDVAAGDPVEGPGDLVEGPPPPAPGATESGRDNAATGPPSVPEDDAVGPTTIDPELDIDPGTLVDPGEPVDSDETQPDGLPPAPAGPTPPGPGDLEVPPIDEGEVLPPPGDNDQAIGPPGRIPLEGMRFLGVPEAEGVDDAADGDEWAPPASIELHPAFSGGYRFDSDAAAEGADASREAEPPDGAEASDPPSAGTDQEGLIVVLVAVDERGRPVDLSRFEIAAELNIVALDPTRPASEARIGKWDYQADQLEELLRERPISGLHVPLRWQGTRPGGDEVVIHARLKSADEEMRCQGRLKLEGSAAVAEWMPRGDQSPRR